MLRTVGLVRGCSECHRDHWIVWIRRVRLEDGRLGANFLCGPCHARLPIRGWAEWERLPEPPAAARPVKTN